MKTYIQAVALLTLLAGMLAVKSAAAPLPTGKPKVLAVLKFKVMCPSQFVFSPDGKTLATTSGAVEDIIRLWDIPSGKCKAELKGSNGADELKANRRADEPKVNRIITGVAFSPDGKTLASCWDESSFMHTPRWAVMLWDVATGRKTATFKYNTSLKDPVFSPDGKTLAVHGDGVLLWDLEKQAIRAKIKAWDPTGPVFIYDPKGKLLIAGRNNYPDEATFSLWNDAAAGKKAIICKGHTKAVTSRAFSRDGKVVASAGMDHTIRLWDVTTGKNTATFHEHPGRNCALAFSPDGKILAAGYKHQEADGESDAFPQRGSVRLYETATGRVLATLKGDPGPIGPLAFSPDGRILASGSFGPHITLWSLPARYEAEK